MIISNLGQWLKGQLDHLWMKEKLVWHAPNYVFYWRGIEKSHQMSREAHHSSNLNFQIIPEFGGYSSQLVLLKLVKGY